MCTQYVDCINYTYVCKNFRRLRELGYGGGGSRFAGHAGNGVCQYIHNTDAGGGQVHMRGARTLWDGREGDENAGINILE